MRAPRRPKPAVARSIDAELDRSIEDGIVHLRCPLDHLADEPDVVLDHSLDQVHGEGIDNEPTIRKLLSRLIGQMHMWVNVIGGRPYSFDIEQHESIDDMGRRLETVGPAFQAEVDRVVEGGRLDETFIVAQHEPVETYTYGGLIAHVLTFAAYRRLPVLGALESPGVPDLGNGDPRKWVVEAA